MILLKDPGPPPKWTPSPVEGHPRVPPNPAEGLGTPLQRAPPHLASVYPRCCFGRPYHNHPPPGRGVTSACPLGGGGGPQSYVGVFLG